MSRDDLIALIAAIVGLVVLVKGAGYLFGLFTDGVKPGLDSDDPIEPTVATELVQVVRAKATAGKDRAAAERIAAGGAMKWGRWFEATKRALESGDYMKLTALADAQGDLCIEEVGLTAVAVGGSTPTVGENDPLSAEDRQRIGSALEAFEDASLTSWRCYVLFGFSVVAIAAALSLDLDDYEGAECLDEEAAMAEMKRALAEDPIAFAAPYARFPELFIRFARQIAAMKEQGTQTFGATRNAWVAAGRLASAARLSAAGARLLVPR